MQPMTKEKPLRVKKHLDSREVRWSSVVDLLCSRYRIPLSGANAIMRRFVKRVDLLFNASWFTRKKLNAEETKLVLSLCEAHGADSIVLTLDKRISAGPIRLEYVQRLSLEPQLGRGRDAPAESSAEIDIKLFGKVLKIRSIVQVVATQLLLLMFAILTYVVFVGAFLKGFATFLLMTQDPLSVTMAATRRFDLLIGLLCFLIGTAGIFGQAIRNTGKLAWSRISPVKVRSVAVATRR